jgi:hypothetical protein
MIAHLSDLGFGVAGMFAEIASLVPFIPYKNFLLPHDFSDMLLLGTSQMSCSSRTGLVPCMLPFLQWGLLTAMSSLVCKLRPTKMALSILNALKPESSLQQAFNKRSVISFAHFDFVCDFRHV